MTRMACASSPLPCVPIRESRGAGDLTFEPTKTQLPATITEAGITTSDAHTSLVVPALIADIGNDASWRYVEFFNRQHP
jgi:hypothetical protein